MRRFFRESVTGPMATRGRWRKNRDDDEIAEIEKRHEIALARLEEAGVSLPDVD